MTRLTPDVALGLRTVVGEAPLWDDRRERLVFVDVLQGELISFDPSSGSYDVTPVGRHLGAVGLAGASGYVAAIREGFGLIEGGELTPCAPFLKGRASHRMNDAQVGPSGRFWGGSMAYDLSDGAGSLSVLSPDLEVTTVLDGLSLPNGMGWSPLGDRFYFIDSLDSAIDVFDFDVESGVLSNRRRFVEIDGEGLPDGLTVDVDGGVWVAVWGGGCVRRFDPRGRLDSQIELPVTQVTSCGFGGLGLDTLFVTTASYELDELALKNQPHAGALFAVSGVGTSGMSANRFPVQISPAQG